jgi:hypothetical protein
MGEKIENINYTNTCDVWEGNKYRFHKLLLNNRIGWSLVLVWSMYDMMQEYNDSFVHTALLLDACSSKYCDGHDIDSYYFCVVINPPRHTQAN